MIIHCTKKLAARLPNVSPDPLGFVDDLPVRTIFDEVQRVPELVKGSIAKPGISGLPEGLQVTFPV